MGESRTCPPALSEAMIFVKGVENLPPAPNSYARSGAERRGRRSARSSGTPAEATTLVRRRPPPGTPERCDNVYGSGRFNLTIEPQKGILRTRPLRAAQHGGGSVEGVLEEIR